MNGRIRSRGANSLAIAGFAIGFALIPVFVTMDDDTAYYGTHVRLAEFLAGVALAVWLRDRDLTGLPPAARRTVGAAGLASLAVLVAVILTIDRESGWLYGGGMSLFALPTVAIIAAISARSRATEAVLGVAPLRTLGRWAFSIYVVHWPLYQLLDDVFSNWPRTALAPFEIAGAIAVGGIVHRFVERPLIDLRRAGDTTPRLVGWWRHDRLAFGALGVTAAAAITLAVALPRSVPVIDFERKEAAAAERLPGMDLQRAQEILRDANLGDVPVLTTDDDRLGVSAFGGSAGLLLEFGKSAWTSTDERLEDVFGYAHIGCGLLTDGHRGVRANPSDPMERPPADVCVPWRDLWAATVVTQDVDIAILVPSQWDLRDWRFDDDSEWRHIGDPVVDERLRATVAEAVDLLHFAGAEAVVMLTPSPFDAVDGAERAARYNQFIDEVARTRPFSFVVDMGGWLAQLPEGERRAMLPDGVHPTDDGARRIWTEAIGPALGPAIEHAVAIQSRNPASS